MIAPKLLLLLLLVALGAQEAGSGSLAGTLVSFAIIAGLILLNGLFVAAEFAIIGVRPSRVEQLAEEGNRTAIGIREVVRSPRNQDRYIATAQLGITIASLGLGMYGEPVIAHLIEGPLESTFGIQGSVVHTVSFLIALSIMTYFHVVVGEMIPKSLALQSPERVVILLAAPMTVTQKLFGPLVTMLNNIGLLVLRLLRIRPPGAGSRSHTPDELELIVTESVEGGLLEPEEQLLIANILDFSDRRVAQIMTPRTRMEAVPVTIDEAALIQRMAALPFSRIPVYEEDTDHVIGILHLKDLVRQQLNEEPYVMRELMRSTPVVPESLPAEQLLALLKKTRQHMAIVIDEYGGTAGVVTLEDLVEEVVGEVRDEFDEGERPPIERVAPDALQVDGALALDDLEELVDLGEHDFDVETAAGLVLALLNRPPVRGDEVAYRDLTFVVEQVDGLAIERITIRENLEPPPPPAEVDEEHADDG